MTAVRALAAELVDGDDARVLQLAGDLALQQELLLKMLQAIEHAGTALAVPLQESFASRRPAES